MTVSDWVAYRQQRVLILKIYYIFEFLFFIMKNSVPRICYSLIGEIFLNVSYFPMPSKSRGVRISNLYEQIPA